MLTLELGYKPLPSRIRRYPISGKLRLMLDFTLILIIINKGFNSGLASGIASRQWLMDILREFLESSTIHGLSYISTSKVRLLQLT